MQREIRTSRNRKFFMPKAIMNSTSTAVMMTPAYRGMLNKRLRATADPMISARSVAAIAISARTHKPYTSHCDCQAHFLTFDSRNLHAACLGNVCLTMRVMEGLCHLHAYILLPIAMR